MFNSSSSKYHQYNTERLQKKNLVENIKILLKKTKKQRDMFTVLKNKFCLFKKLGKLKKFFIAYKEFLF